MIRLSFELLLKVLVLCLALTGLARAENPLAAPGIKPPGSILFAGNSFTFYNNAIYTHLRKLLVAADPASRRTIFLKSMTISGARLADHGGGLDQMLALRSWDVVVLQGHSREAIEADMLPGFRSAIGEFGKAVSAQDGQAVLFMTWAYADRPEMTQPLAEAFASLGKEFNMPVVPVGLAFERAAGRINGLVLHDPDRIHPSLEGTYLAAAVFYGALYGKSPAPLAYDAGLEPNLARKLRLIAWETVRDYSMQ